MKNTTVKNCGKATTIRTDEQLATFGFQVTPTVALKIASRLIANAEEGNHDYIWVEKKDKRVYVTTLVP
jgi:hypothetical protein